MSPVGAQSLFQTICQAVPPPRLFSVRSPLQQDWPEACHCCCSLGGPHEPQGPRGSSLPHPYVGAEGRLGSSSVTSWRGCYGLHRLPSRKKGRYMGHRLTESLVCWRGDTKATPATSFSGPYLSLILACLVWCPQPSFLHDLVDTQRLYFPCTRGDL